MTKSIPNCHFCDIKIINNQKIFENNFIYVLCNIRPANKGQCVIIPKRHITNIRELNNDELNAIFQTAQDVSNKLNNYLKPIGFNYGFNESEYSGQSIEHFHFHIMPRFEGDKPKLPEYHLFHRDPNTKNNLSNDQLQPLVTELKKLF